MLGVTQRLCSSPLAPSKLPVELVLAQLMKAQAEGKGAPGAAGGGRIGASWGRKGKVILGAKRECRFLHFPLVLLTINECSKPRVDLVAARLQSWCAAVGVS